MEISKTSNRIHPLVATAAVSVMLASLVGVAAITGVLPNSHSSNASVASLATPADSTASNANAAADATLAANSGGDASTKETAAPAASQHAQPVRAPIRHPQPRAAYSNDSTAVAQASGVCTNCGRVESIRTIQQPAKPSGLGIAAGAVLGGVLGNQVGGGNGRTLATVAGAVGGGYAGNEVEKRTRATTTYQVRVRMDDGSIRTFPYAEQPGWGAGDRIRIVNGNIRARG